METIKLSSLIEDPSKIPCRWIDKVEYICPSCGKLVQKAKRYIVWYGYNCYKCNQTATRHTEEFRTRLVASQRKTFLKNYGVTNPGQIEKNKKILSENGKKVVKRTGGIAKYFKEHKEECLEKRKKTWLEKYGVDNPSKSSV